MSTVNISVTDEMMAFIESRVSAGDFQSVSEYLGELVKQDRERMELRDRLLIEGLESGNSRPLSMAGIRERAVSRLGK